MDIEQEHVIERECTKVLMQCRRHGDMGEFDKAGGLFTTDVHFQSGDSEPIIGRDANIAAMHANISDVFMRCVISNVLVSVTDADHATSTSYWIMYVHKKADLAAGNVKSTAPNRFSESEDEFVRTDEGWRISRRHFKTVL